MANYNSMALVEDYILENIGSFINEVTDLDVYLIDQPWPSDPTPTIGMQIIDYSDSNGWGETTRVEDDRFVAETDLTFEVEILAKAGRPMATLSYLIQAFRGFQELKYKHLYSKNIGVLSVSNATVANTVYDSIETEKRARMTVTFNARIKALDIEAVNLIETINGSIFANIRIPFNLETVNALYEVINFRNLWLQKDYEIPPITIRSKEGYSTIVYTFNVIKTT